MIRQRYEAVGMDRETFMQIITYLKEAHSFEGRDHVEALARFAEALAAAFTKFNLTPEQLAVLAYDAGQFTAITKLANGQFEDLDPSHLSVLTDE